MTSCLPLEIAPRSSSTAVRLIDEEVDSKGGLTGLAVKGAYALVKRP